MKQQDIVHGLEFHGRLLQVDGRPMRAGTYSLRFGLHADARIRRSSWAEVQPQVEVGSLGHFHVVLGSQTPMQTKQFDGRSRWVSTSVVLAGQVQQEQSQRVRVLGRSLQLEERIEQMEAVIERQSLVLQELSAGPCVRALADRIEALEHRTKGQQEGEVQRLTRELRALAERAEALLGEGGRLDTIEDRLEDLDGPDGDVVDLNERMDRIEGQLPAEQPIELRRVD